MKGTSWKYCCILGLTKGRDFMQVSGTDIWRWLNLLASLQSVCFNTYRPAYWGAGLGWKQEGETLQSSPLSPLSPVQKWEAWVLRYRDENRLGRRTYLLSLNSRKQAEWSWLTSRHKHSETKGLPWRPMSDESCCLLWWPLITVSTTWSREHGSHRAKLQEGSAQKGEKRACAQIWAQHQPWLGALECLFKPILFQRNRVGIELGEVRGKSLSTLALRDRQTDRLGVVAWCCHFLLHVLANYFCVRMHWVPCSRILNWPGFIRKTFMVCWRRIPEGSSTRLSDHAVLIFSFSIFRHTQLPTSQVPWTDKASSLTSSPDNIQSTKQ